jgi:hypothetical protein
MNASDFRLVPSRSALGLAAALVLLFGLPGAAPAHDVLTDIGSTVDRGAVNALLGTKSQPWVRKYFAPAGFCLFLQVIEVVPSVDLEMVVVGPSPLDRWRDDDSGATGTCFNCPRVEIDPTPTGGYYTVNVNQFFGGPANADFRILYSRLASGIGSCPNPTSRLPLPPAATRLKK